MMLVRIVLLTFLLVARAAFAEAVFSGSTGAPLDRATLLAKVRAADVIIIGESHTDAGGHAWQQELLQALFTESSDWVLSLEEFDRSQQSDLDRFASGDITGEQLRDVRVFVGQVSREKWPDWSLPKLTSARAAGAALLASNAPLKYSRMVRNAGCDVRRSLPEDEQALFDCPAKSPTTDYQTRFYRTMERMSRSQHTGGMKPLEPEQLAKLFRAHRVWDATMAASITQARAAGSPKIIHIVGSFHSDYEGGLIQELRVRDPAASILTITIRPRRAQSLPDADRGRADILVYRGQ